MWLSCVPSSHFLARFSEMQFRPGPIFQTMQCSWESIYMLLKRKLGPSWLSIAFYAKLVNPKAGRKAYIFQKIGQTGNLQWIWLLMLTLCWTIIRLPECSQLNAHYNIINAVYSWTISRLPCLQQTSTTICFLIWSHSAVAKKDYQYGNKFASPSCSCRMKSFVLWNKEHLW